MTLPVKHKARSLLWSYTQVSIHSGVLKNNNNKECQVHLSNSKKHDQSFARAVLFDMLKDYDLANKFIIIEIDSVSSQNISAQHFNTLQELSDTF